MDRSRDDFTVFVRFQGAILLVAVTAVCGSVLEGAALDRRRAGGRQHYRLDVLRERVARLRLRCEELGAPSRLDGQIEAGRLDLVAPTSRTEVRSAGPLLRWRASSRGSR